MMAIGRKGFVNSWSLAFVALSILVLMTTLMYLQSEMSSLNSGYAVELSRWYGDAAYASSKAGSCNPNIFELTIVRDFQNIHTNSSRHIRNLSYIGPLVNINMTYKQNYPPYVSFEDPKGNSEIDCTALQAYTFDFYVCDPDQDSMTLTIYEDNGTLREIGSRTCNNDFCQISVDCADLSEGKNDYIANITDSEYIYTARVENVTVKKIQS